MTVLTAQYVSTPAQRKCTAAWLGGAAPHVTHTPDRAHARFEVRA